MSTVQMRDSSQAPTTEQVRLFVADRVVLWGLYLGGRTPHVYSAQEVQALRDGGIQRFVGFWVGPLRNYGQAFTYQLGHNEGAQACRQAQAAGLTVAEVIVCPDIEDNAEGPDVDDYCRGFKDAVRSFWPADLAGYGNPGTINSGAFSGYDGVIIADYLTPPATSPYDPRLPMSGWQSRRGVQAVGTHTEHGMSVDTSYLDSWFLGATPAQPPVDPPSLSLGEDIVVKRIGIAVTTDGNGNGWDSQFQQRNVPWTSCVGAPFLNGSDPDLAVDKAYWPGFAKAQQRDGLLLVEVVSARPNNVEIVWQDVNDGTPATPPPSNTVPAHTHAFSGTLSGSTGEPQ